MGRDACPKGPVAKHQSAMRVISWFEFIDFRRDIVVGSLFGGHQFLGKAAPNK